MFHATFFMDLTQNGVEFSGYLQMTCDCTDYENGSYISIKAFKNLTLNNWEIEVNKHRGHDPLEMVQNINRKHLHLLTFKMTSNGEDL